VRSTVWGKIIRSPRAQRPPEHRAHRVPIGGEAVDTEQQGRAGGAGGHPPQRRRDQGTVARRAEAAQAQPRRDGQRHRLPDAPRAHLDTDLIGLHLTQFNLSYLHHRSMHPCGVDPRVDVLFRAFRSRDEVPELCAAA